MRVMRRSAPYEYYERAHTPDFPVVDWVHDPDFSGVTEVPQKYRKVQTGTDNIAEMTQVEKDAIDAADAAVAADILQNDIVGRTLVQNEDAVSPEIAEFVQDNAIWTDSITGLKGPPTIIQGLVLAREMYGHQDNPLCPSGYAGNLLSRTNSLELIHGKLGWHRLEIRDATYFRPDDMLIYYAGLSSMNGLGNNELVAQEMSKYGVCVLPATIESSGHWDYDNTTVILPRARALNPCQQQFGYVDTMLAQAAFEARVDDWVTLGVRGIFMDQAGYQYGTPATNGRAAFNAKVNYIHNQDMLAFVNCWNMDHIIGVEDDPAKPNTTWNPSLLASSLTENDWYLLESCPVNTQTGDAQFIDDVEIPTDWVARCEKAVLHRATYGINVAAAGIIETGHSNGEDLAQFHHIAALMYSLDAVSISDHNYGASSGSAYWWPRPDFTGIGRVGWYNPSVQVHQGDSDVYLRQVQFGTVQLDFSTGAKASSLTKR